MNSPGLKDFIHRHHHKNHLAQHNNNITAKVLLGNFYLNGHKSGFHLQKQTKLWTTFFQHNKQHLVKVLLTSFPLNGHTLGIQAQTQKLETPCTA